MPAAAVFLRGWTAMTWPIPNDSSDRSITCNGIPTFDLVGTWAIVFRAGGKPIGKRAGAETHEQICARPHAGFPLIHPTYLGRIDFFQRNRYRSSAVRCEDQDLLLRSFEGRPRPLPGGLAKSQDQDLLIRSYGTARFANVPEVLLGYRENTIDLNKILISRYYLIKSLWHELRNEGARSWPRVPSSSRR